MAISSIHIEAGKMGFFGHNSRELLTKNAIFDDEKNYFSTSSAKAIKLYKEELAKRSEAYTQRVGQKLHSKTITHLSAIVNFNKEHTPEDIKKVCDYLEEKFDTKVIQYAMHRDEGHITDDGEKIKNYHAHIEFLGLDSQGNSVRRKLDKKALINLQTDVANILDMQRGRNYTLEKTDRPKRLGTYEFKAHKKEEAKSVKAKQADLNKEFEALRKELIETKKATAKDYQILREEKELYKTLVKEKELSIDELKDNVNTLREKLIKSEKETEDTVLVALEINDFAHMKKNKEFEALLNDLRNENIRFKAENETQAKQLKAQETILKQFQEYFKAPKETLKNTLLWVKDRFFSQEEEIKTLSSEIEDLKNQINGFKTLKKVSDDKILELEKKMLSRANMSDYEQLESIAKTSEDGKGIWEWEELEKIEEIEPMLPSQVKLDQGNSNLNEDYLRK